jgi:hypothetical protein
MAQEIIFAQNVQLSFPHLAEAYKGKMAAPGATAKFSADFILTPDHPALKSFMERYAELAQQKWAENAGVVMQMIQSDRKLRCFGPGSEKIDKKTFKPYQGYEGNYFIAASRENAPQMIRPDGSPVEPTNVMEYQTLARKVAATSTLHCAPGCRTTLLVAASVATLWRSSSPRTVHHSVTLPVHRTCPICSVP